MLVFYLYTSVCTFVGQWMSVLMPNAKVANVAVGAISCLLNLFSGFLLPNPQMSSFYQWIQYIMPSYYSLAALVGIQLGECNGQDNNIACRQMTVGNGTKTVEEWVKGEYNLHPESRWAFTFALLGFWVVIQIAIYLTLKYVSHLKR
ncbi:hypothetical protein ATCC90586_000009 [Pythium insidiosum]|nr:hypothetical protein ATCC90586_000009 [Pythium insidiosum]